MHTSSDSSESLHRTNFNLECAAAAWPTSTVYFISNCDFRHKDDKKNLLNAILTFEFAGLIMQNYANEIQCLENVNKYDGTNISHAGSSLISHLDKDAASQLVDQLLVDKLFITMFFLVMLTCCQAKTQMNVVFLL